MLRHAANLKTNLPLDTSSPGTYIVKFNVKDEAGNKALQKTRKVKVRSADEIQLRTSLAAAKLMPSAVDGMLRRLSPRRMSAVSEGALEKV